MSEKRDLDADRAVCEACPEGPYEVGGPWPSVSVIVCVGVDRGGCYDEPAQNMYEPLAMIHQSHDYTTPPPKHAEALAKLFAVSRTALPYYIDRTESAEKRLKRIEELCEDYSIASPRMRAEIIKRIHEKAKGEQ